MKKDETAPVKFDSISDAHRAFGLPKPKHPLISLISGVSVRADISADGMEEETGSMSSPHVLGFYKISYRPKIGSKLKYGQQYYDFNEGGMLFASPNQVLGGHGGEEGPILECSAFALLIHPDFLWNYPLAKKIKQYGFFSYSAHEGLYVSEEEKATIFSIFQMIESELNSRIDDFSQDVVISQVELLLNYANRFYKRQFLTRKAVSSDLLQKLEELVDGYFGDEVSLSKGIPTVQFLADKLALSPSYLSDMLRSLIGQNAQQYIHGKLIEKAKEKLSTTDLTVSEVAYALGFEHSQSFNKLFKAKTNLSPLEFRRSFN